MTPLNTSWDNVHWALRPFWVFLESWKDILSVYVTADRGIQAAFYLNRAEHFGWNEVTTSLADIQEILQTLAPEELGVIRRQQAVLFGQGLVACWSGLEASIRDFVGQWLLNDPVARSVPTVRKHKGELIDFLGLEPDDQLALLVESLERELQSGLPYSATRFEVLLGVAGLRKSVPAHIDSDLYVLGQLRNVFAHQAGIADVKFIRSCKAYPAVKGQLILLTEDDFHRYTGAAFRYIFDVIQRIDERYELEDDLFWPLRETRN